MKKPTLSDKAAVAMILVPFLGTSPTPVFAVESTPSKPVSERKESVAGSDPATGAASAKGSGSRTPNELKQAFDELRAAAERLGKSLAKNADENTAEARQQILKTMTGAVHELSKSMNQASKRLEAKASDQSVSEQSASATSRPRPSSKTE